MEKETLLSKIKAKIGNPDDKGFFKNGVSARTLAAYVDSVCAGVPDDADDASLDGLVKVVDAMGGQMRHQVAETIKAAPPAAGEGNGTPATGSDGDAMGQLLQLAQSMKTGYDEIKARLDNFEKNKSVTEYRSSLAQAMKAKGAHKDAVIDVVLGNSELDTTKGVDEVLDSYLAEYDKKYARFYGDGESPRQADGGSWGGKDDAFLDSYFKKKSDEGRMPKENK